MLHSYDLVVVPGVDRIQPVVRYGRYWFVHVQCDSEAERDVG